MNLRDIEYLVAVSDFGSFSKAASSCGVSQPSLSTQVKKVEDELGVRIFQRGPRQAVVTPAGELVLVKARAILQLQAEMEGIARSHAEALEGRVRLGAILTIAPYLYPALMQYARVHVPAVQLELKEAKTEELVADLIEDRIDAAVLSLPTDDNVFESQQLFVDPFLLAVPEGHELAAQESVFADAMKGERLILLEEGHCFREQALAVCSSLEARENPAFRSASFETVRYLVAVGEGITLFPKMARRSNDGLVYLPFADVAPSREIGLVWRKGSRRHLFLSKLSAMVEEASRVFVDAPKPQQAVSLS